ncbi:MAG: argininosuccinate lyase [Deltaproteobacteria bacterium]
MAKKAWSGRFVEETDKQVEAFTSSLSFDKRLYSHDIDGSIAHVKMLATQEIIASDEAKLIVNELGGIREDIRTGVFIFQDSDEDIHMAIERELIARIGDVGGKLHTARSRNDQVSLDTRLYLRSEIKTILNSILTLKTVLVKVAKAEIDTIMPGYTHMQRAQPVLLSHYLLAFWEMFDRDEERLEQCLERVNVMPLGSAALAGVSLPIDRTLVAKELQFPKITQNSMDAVSDRDFVTEFIFDASLIMAHASRFCEDLIIWSTDEFSFVNLPDSFTTGSSIMPQKKNPDVAELIRGKSARIYGNLFTLLTLIKGLPMTYNRDLQEDKEPLFDTVDTVKSSVNILAQMIAKTTFNRDVMFRASTGGFSTATDIAEYLVKNGVDFRQAHGIVGKMVRYCIDNNKTLFDLSIKEMKLFYSGFKKDIFERISVDDAVNARNGIGATGKKTVLKRIKIIEGAKR